MREGLPSETLKKVVPTTTHCAGDPAWVVLLRLHAASGVACS